MPHRFLVSWQDFYRDAKALAWRLRDKGPWEGLIAITRGGLVPASLVAYELDIRKIDTISAVSYDEDDTQSDVEIIKSCDIPEGGKRWLVIDDLADSGVTMEAVRTIVPHAHFAVVYAKPAGVSAVDTFMTEVSQDTWIVFPWEEEV